MVSSLISFRRTLLCVLFSFIGCALAESRFLSLVVQILSSPPPFSPLTSFFFAVSSLDKSLSLTHHSLLITLDLPFPLSFPFEWHWSMNSNHGYWPLSFSMERPVDLSRWKGRRDLVQTYSSQLISLSRKAKKEGRMRNKRRELGRFVCTIWDVSDEKKKKKESQEVDQSDIEVDGEKTKNGLSMDRSPLWIMEVRMRRRIGHSKERERGKWQGERA